MAQGTLTGSGPRGPRGAQGAAGSQGQQGFGVLGFDGEEGPEGPQGMPGVPGATGATGATGADGAPGAAGPPGMDGETGETGESHIIIPTLQEVLDFTSLSRFPRRVGLIQAGNLAATSTSSVVATGVPLISFDGTPGAVIQGTGGLNGGFGYFGSHTTSTANANVAGHRSTAEWTEYQNKPYMRLYWRTGGDVSNLRYWFGVFSTLPTTTDDPTGHVAGVRFSNASGGAGDTTFRFITKDNVTLNNQDSTITPAALTAYLLEIDMTQSGAITFRMNDGTTRVEQVLSSNLPTATVDLFFVFRVVNGNSGATRTIRVGAFYLSTL